MAEYGPTKTRAEAEPEAPEARSTMYRQALERLMKGCNRLDDARVRGMGRVCLRRGGLASMEEMEGHMEQRVCAWARARGG